MKKFEIALEELENSISNNENKNYFYGQKNRFSGNFKLISNYLHSSDKILEVGSYPSYFLAAVKKCGYNVEGLDLNPKRETTFLAKENLTVKKCDIEQEMFPFEDNSFDKIMLSEVFEHLYVNPVFTISEIRRVLKKDGLLILTTPNGYSIKRLYNFMMGRGASENPFDEFNKINTVGHRGHIREYCVYELKDFLKKSGLLIKDVHYVSFDHLGLKNKPFLSSVVKLIYFTFPKFRSHLVIIARK